MTEYADEKDQKWKELKSKWSAVSLSKPIIQEPTKSALNKKQTESKSLSDLSNSLQKQLDRKQATIKEIQSHQNTLIKIKGA